MSDRLTLFAGGLQASALVLGHLYGLEVHYPGRPPSIYTNLAQLAVILMLVGALVSPLTRSVEECTYRTAVCAGSLLYSAGIVFFEPFLVHDLRSIIIAFALLVPLCLAIGYLIRGRAWVSVAGVFLFLFPCSAMLASNLNVADAGSGFYAWWTS